MFDIHFHTPNGSLSILTWNSKLTHCTPEMKIKIFAIKDCFMIYKYISSLYMEFSFKSLRSLLCSLKSFYMLINTDYYSSMLRGVSSSHHSFSHISNFWGSSFWDFHRHYVWHPSVSNLLRWNSKLVSEPAC